MRENREVALSFVFEDEGKFVLRPDGGRANMGIGLHTLYDYRKRHKLNIPTYWDIEHLKKKKQEQFMGNSSLIVADLMNSFLVLIMLLLILLLTLV